MSAIRAINLKKSFRIVEKDPGLAGTFRAFIKPKYKLVEAVKGISFDIQPGELVGFLGPNGAGKTTTLKMLSGVLYPTEGKSDVLGFDPIKRKPELLSQISLVMGNKQQLWWDLPAQDGLRVIKELYGVSDAEFKVRLEELAELLEVKDKLATQVRRLSLGERMKCELIAALLYKPKVIFLDEPTLGLDLMSQTRIREFLKRVNQVEGSTLVLTSHYMQDVEQLCERVIIIDHGSVVYDGSLKTLIQEYSSSKRLRISFAREIEKSDLSQFGIVIEHALDHAIIEVAANDIARATSSLLQTLPITDLNITEVPIEEVISSMFKPVSK